jgi:hypothetical protein
LRPIENTAQLLLLPLALCGFAVAQPIYNLLLQTPVFLVARQNTPIDIWALVFVLSFALPLGLALPAWLSRRRWPVFSSMWCWAICGGFAALFVAQLLQSDLGDNWILYAGLSAVIGIATAWILLFTKWSVLGTILAVPAIVFPLWFLLFSPLLEQVDNFAVVSPDRKKPDQPLPDIVFVILDELPLATLVDATGQIDKSLFPGIARLQSMSDWYFDTSSVSDGTGVAVPAILTGQYPSQELSDLTVADHPVNLFTILRHHYAYNVTEAVTRFCPQALCPRVGPGNYNRIKALLLDVTAIYLHRVVPDLWASQLPSVTNNWSGFFAERQVFFPAGWMTHAGAQTEIDRPGYFKQFTNSIHKSDKPVLNFMHILFPHEPNAYLPNGQNYGLQWMRGQLKELWGDVEWGVISGKQRHFLQVQYVDQLLNNLLDHLQQQDLLDNSMLIVVADHGISFELNDTRRALSDINQAALLRVPLFIKHPEQIQGRRIVQPAMTIDILPTLITSLGFSNEILQFDGIDLGTSQPTPPRQRKANSHLARKLRVIEESELDISALVTENRTQLKLDDPAKALWNIGPNDDFRGQSMDLVCEKTASDIRVHYEKFTPLPNSDPRETIQAYVVGSFIDKPITGKSEQFLITNNDLIVASGATWMLNGQPNFFALVEPDYVGASRWQPKAWLLEDGLCFGTLE